MKLIRTLALPLLAAAVVLPACSSSSSKAASSSTKAAPPASGSSAGAPAAAGATDAITIKNFAFNPAKVKAGATVAVMNTDGTAHTVTADDKSFDTKRLEGNAKGMFTAPTKPGTYAFHCDIHDYMKGTLTVS
ncbi:MAG: hypothetical protein NVSMB16_04350 [Acidimicrobiales bacterium]